MYHVGCLENNDLENVNLENNGLENNDLENNDLEYYCGWGRREVRAQENRGGRGKGGRWDK